ncbi:MAG: hypothetical protein PHT54_04735 [Candidatus Nanoarchaeia archaeon]|nr:hypothetical protein [Candidatus Nanoarchaeia archaeon]
MIKLLEQKWFKWGMVLIIGLILWFAPIQKPLTQKELAGIIIIFSILGLLSSIISVYHIKFAKSKDNFKSDKEKFIAYYFNKKHIKFLYEKKLNLGKDTFTPDFYLPEFDVYVEYWGRWDKDFDYKQACRKKRQTCEKSKIDLIELFPDNLSSFSQLDWKFTERLLSVLKKR